MIGKLISLRFIRYLCPFGALRVEFCTSDTTIRDNRWRKVRLKENTGENGSPESDTEMVDVRKVD